MLHPEINHAARGWRRSGLVLAAGVAATAFLALVSGNATGGGLDASATGVALSIYGVLIYTGVGVMILWRRPGHGIGRLALTLGMGFSVAIIIDALLQLSTLGGAVRRGVSGWLAIVRDVAEGATIVLPASAIALGAILLVAWFPDGRATSRAGRAVQWLLALVIVGLLSSGAREPVIRSVGWSEWWDRIFTAAAVIAMGSLILALVLAVVDLGLRYRRSDVVRRAQIRWVFAAASLSVLMTALALISGSGILPEIVGLWDLWLFSTMLPVLAIGIAITRYHLYDIDRIVSRSISYAVVTAVLFALFGGLILLMQSLISGAVARPGARIDPVAVAASTLVVAALSNPVRIRVQGAVDRRFHRARYDAEHTVAGFAGRLRDELDLPTLTAELRRATTEAVEPASTGVWLRGRA